MVVNCCVCKVVWGCPQSFDVTFHRFPTNEDLKLKWWEAIGKKTSSPYAVICSKHFKVDDYKNYEDPNLIRKILKPTAVPSIHIKLSKKLENFSSDIEDISIENKNDSSVPLNVKLGHENDIVQNESFDNGKLQIDESNVSTNIDMLTNKRTLNNETRLCSTANQTKKKKIIDKKLLKLLKRLRYQNNILGVVRRGDLINENAWFRFQKYINEINEQCNLLLSKNRKLEHEISNLKDLLREQLSDDSPEV